MQNIIIDRPYEFVPPHRGRLWPKALGLLLPAHLRRSHGVTTVRAHGAEKLERSLATGDGVLLTPNHPRPCDPPVMFQMLRQIGVLPFMMASWHVFMQSRWQSFALRRSGAFSVYREGMDRASLSAAIGILEEGGRPLVIFPEGVQTRSNDYLNPLQEGVAFIARMAARSRAKADPNGRVVVHPVALRYRFPGDVRKAVEPALEEIEHRLSWRPQSKLSLEARITKVGLALLALKEIEYFDEAQRGTIAERTQRLIDGLLAPLEAEWLDGAREGHVVGRVKALRTAVLRGMVEEDLSEVERDRRWSQMADMYLAQAVSLYHPEYLAENLTPERLLETVERFEEDLTDECRVYGRLDVDVTIGDAIVVAPTRARRDAGDPLLEQIEQDLNRLLGLTP